MSDTIAIERERTDEEREYYSLNMRVYHKFAPFYDLVAWPIKRLRREVVSVTKAGAQSRVLDVATGTGEQALAFSARCREVVGVDLSEDMLQVATRKSRHPNLTFLQARQL